MLAIPVLGRQRYEDCHQFKVSRGTVVRKMLCLQTNKNNNNKQKSYLFFFLKKKAIKNFFIFIFWLSKTVLSL